jgi:hypothetical protein
MSKGIRGIREQIYSGSINHEIQKEERKVNRTLHKEVANDDYDSEEEDKVWTAISDRLSDVKNTISTLNDPEKEWVKASIDGKQSNKNFQEWLDKIMGLYHKIQKSKDDEELFN